MRHSQIATPLLATLVLASPAYAVDGVIEINQARALTGGVTATDTPGFPVTIDAAGSYRLTSNLSLATAATEGIRIAGLSGSNVTVDLNGFEIACDTCASASSGNGIRSDTNNTTIRNGTVRNVGNNGVWLLGTQNRVDNVRVIDAHGLGIRIESRDCSVTNTTAVGNALTGIAAGEGCLIAGNVSSDNGGHGIFVSEKSTIHNNVARSNLGTGIVCQSESCMIEGNTSANNSGAGINAEFYSVVTNNIANNNGSFGIDIRRGVVRGNSVTGNASFGLNGDTGTGYGGNSFTNNGGVGNQVSAGPHEIDANVCGFDLICP